MMNSLVLDLQQEVLKADCDVLNALRKEHLSDEDKEGAMELISETEAKIMAQKKPGVIKAALSGLRDFLIAGGANVTAALIVQYL